MATASTVSPANMGATSSSPVVKLTRQFNPMRLEADLAALCDVAGKPAGYPGEGHTSWTSITLFPAARSGPDLLVRVPYFRQVMEELSCTVLLARLMVLEPGGIIKEHRDAFLEHSVVRLHIPIVTHPDVDFHVGGVRCQWLAGELWYGDFSLPHSAHNRSSLTRVHLVIDVTADNRLANLFPDQRAPRNFVDRAPPTSTSQFPLNRFVFRFRLPAGFRIPGTDYQSLPSDMPASVELLDDMLAIYVGGQPMLHVVAAAADALDLIGLGVPAQIICQYEDASPTVTNAMLVIGGAPSGIPLEVEAARPHPTGPD